MLRLPEAPPLEALFPLLTPLGPIATPWLLEAPEELAPAELLTGVVLVDAPPATPLEDEALVKLREANGLGKLV